MTNMPISTLADEAAIKHIEREVDEAISIYSCLYPTQTLDFIIYEGKNPIWGAPSVVEGEITFGLEHVRAEFIGRIRHPGLRPDAPTVTIRLDLPRKPSPAEIRQTEAPWKPLKHLGGIYRLSPILYEDIRYQAEMIRKKRSRKKHPMISLPCGTGAMQIPGPPVPSSDKRPAILIGMHWLEMGGAEKLGFDTVQWALEAGLRVLVVAGVSSIQRLADKLPQSEDVKFIRLDRYLPYHLWPRYLEKLILAENIKLIHIHHCRQIYDALPHIRMSNPGIKVIDSTHIIEYVDGGYPRTSGVWSNFIDVHHVISGELTEYFRDNFHALGKVRLGRMLGRAEKSDGLPSLNMKVGQKTLDVIFIGRLYYQKRPVLVIEALRALSVWAKANDVHLKGKIVGEGPFLDTLRRLLQQYRLAEIVDLLPAQSDVPALLRQSDILLLPSNNEGLALVCYEAIEQGCIPISTNVGSQNEVVPADLLVPLAPRKTVRGIVNTVDNLWRDAAFMQRQEAEMSKLWGRLSSDPTAKEVLMPIYREAANSKGVDLA
jgi:glycosyltransferase involved in cell wall biosynthesis